MSELLSPIPEQLKEVRLDEEGESIGIGRESSSGLSALISFPAVVRPSKSFGVDRKGIVGNQGFFERKCLLLLSRLGVLSALRLVTFSGL